MIKVYHADDFTHTNYGYGMGLVDEKVYKAARHPDLPGYRLVAMPETNELEKAWELTNTVYSSWYDNPVARPQSTARLRSSMVGDIFELENGQRYIVASVGFYKVEA